VLNAEHRSLRRALMHVTSGGRIGLDARKRAVVRALRGLSFEFFDGDRVGLIGRNGAGKSTLLRVLAGIYHPTSGECVVEGKVASLLNLGFGLRDDATGYENIRLSGLLLGISMADIEQRAPDIAAFSELGEHLALSVGTYSAGMRTRLAFSIATAFEPEILLIDEVFGAGDAGFLHKAEKRMNDLVTAARITVFASHSTSLIERLCDKALLLEEGKSVMGGPVTEVVREYERRLEESPSLTGSRGDG